MSKALVAQSICTIVVLQTAVEFYFFHSYTKKIILWFSIGDNKVHQGTQVLRDRLSEEKTIHLLQVSLKLRGKMVQFVWREVHHIASVDSDVGLGYTKQTCTTVTDFLQWN
ncbi:Protein RecA, partial [Frankliniella fusca]